MSTDKTEEIFFICLLGFYKSSKKKTLPKCFNKTEKSVNLNQLKTN